MLLAGLTRFHSGRFLDSTVIVNESEYIFCCIYVTLLTTNVLFVIYTPDLLKTNREKLVRISVIGEVSPVIGDSIYYITTDNEPVILPGVGW